MSKQLQEYSATLISINAVPSQQDSDWSWRLRYVGNQGKISIMQDEYKRPNKVFITMAITDEEYIKTSPGTLVQDGNILTLTTNQSIYKFKIEL